MGARLIAEIGGSSSRWAFIPVSGDPLIFPRAGEVLPGYNPLSGDAGIFSNGVKEYFDRNCAQVFEAVELNVYGAGCGTAERQDLMSGALRTLWPEAKIAVDSDLMAAALGLCDGSPALVVILGTGMNAGHFDGRVLHRPMPSLGYILGDEGSGADIGKTLLQDAFYRRMPPDVMEVVFGTTTIDVGAMVNEVYRSPFPARTLAARTARLVPIIERPYVRDLVMGRFHALAELLKEFFSPEQRNEAFATGSVAFGLRDLLAECLSDHGISLVRVEKDPLAGLIKVLPRR